MKTREATRHTYVDESLTRTSEWLQDKGVREILGATATTAVEGLIGRLYIPNIVRAGSWYVSLETPSEYRDDAWLPIMAGFPGDRFIPSGMMRRQTQEQRYGAIARLAEVYGDAQRATSVVESLASRTSRYSNGTQRCYVSRYDTMASVFMTYAALGPEDRRQFVFSRPTTLLTMGDMDEGLTVASPAVMIHELLHLEDHLLTGAMAVQSMRAYLLRSELKSHHYGSRIEGYALEHGLMRPDERSELTIDPTSTSFSQDFEHVRLAHADQTDPFAPLAVIDNALVAARLMRSAQ